MLVRARVKPIDQLPEWAKCCGHAMHLSGNDDPPFTVDLDRRQDEGIAGHCTNCGSPIPAGIDVWALADDNGPAGWVQLECLDLDEGPLEAA